MKKTSVIGIIAVLVIAVVGYFLMKMEYSNGALKLDQEAQMAWSNVETAYQRRGDLIPNLVEVVKKAASHERETLEAVVAARAKATSVNIDPSKITPEQLDEFQKAQSGVSSALGRLMVVSERYPDLKANEQFLKLSDELTSTENQILTSRTRYNEAVGNFNGYILKMPNSFFISGYTPRVFFKADKGAEKAPKVQF